MVAQVVELQVIRLVIHHKEMVLLGKEQVVDEELVMAQAEAVVKLQQVIQLVADRTVQIHKGETVVQVNNG